MSTSEGIPMFNSDTLAEEGLTARGYLPRIALPSQECIMASAPTINHSLLSFAMKWNKGTKSIW